MPTQSLTAIPRAVFGAPVDHVAAEDDVAEPAILRVTSSRLRQGVLLLEPDEQWVVISRFGLAGARVRTLRELAGDMGISPATVLRIERRAIESLRTWM